MSSPNKHKDLLCVRAAKRRDLSAYSQGISGRLKERTYSGKLWSKNCHQSHRGSYSPGRHTCVETSLVVVHPGSGSPANASFLWGSGNYALKIATATILSAASEIAHGNAFPAILGTQVLILIAIKSVAVGRFPWRASGLKNEVSKTGHLE